jgi:PAS domain S-box-containing protein
MIREGAGVPTNAAKAILVVDDHPVNRLLVASLVRDLGYRLLEAENGEQALALVRSERPALVISDILMPLVDGFEFVRRLRADSAVAQTAVIFCTSTYREAEAKELARIGGVFRVFSKPFDPGEMLQAVKQALAREPSEAPAGIEPAFDREHLRLVTDKLSAQEAALRRAHRVARLAHLVTRTDGSFETWSEMLPEITGFDDERMPRSTRAWLDHIHPDDREMFRAKVIAAARYGLRTELEYTFRRPDGSWVILSQLMEPLHQGMRSQDDARWFSTIQDVSVQKRAEEEVRRLNADLERRVAERTAELEAAMKELEAFDYSISHDLRGPINRIRGFTEALIEDHAAGLDVTARDLVRRIAAAGERMDQLVNDLFSLSTVSRGELRLGHVDVTALAKVVAAALARAHPDRKVAVEIEPRLTARADPGLLRIALENLLGNAWKFTSRRDEARVEVGSERGEPTVFFVRDNGAGFDSSKAGRLFAPFQRLHDQRDYEGTGIGLATVGRIVSRHGGRAWAEGAVGKGATIRFTLSRGDAVE